MYPTLTLRRTRACRARLRRSTGARPGRLHDPARTDRDGAVWWRRSGRRRSCLASACTAIGRRLLMTTAMTTIASALQRDRPAEGSVAIELDRLTTAGAISSATRFITFSSG